MACWITDVFRVQCDCGFVCESHDERTEARICGLTHKIHCKEHEHEPSLMVLIAETGCGKE